MSTDQIGMYISQYTMPMVARAFENESYRYSFITRCRGYYLCVGYQLADSKLYLKYSNGTNEVVQTHSAPPQVGGGMLDDFLGIIQKGRNKVVPLLVLPPSTEEQHTPRQGTPAHFTDLPIDVLEIIAGMISNQEVATDQLRLFTQFITDYKKHANLSIAPINALKSTEQEQPNPINDISTLNIRIFDIETLISDAKARQPLQYTYTGTIFIALLSRMKRMYLELDAHIIIMKSILAYIQFSHIREMRIIDIFSDTSYDIDDDEYDYYSENNEEWFYSFVAPMLSMKLLADITHLRKIMVRPNRVRDNCARLQILIHELQKYSTDVNAMNNYSIERYIDQGIQYANAVLNQEDSLSEYDEGEILEIIKYDANDDFMKKLPELFKHAILQVGEPNYVKVEELDIRLQLHSTERKTSLQLLEELEVAKAKLAEYIDTIQITPIVPALATGDVSHKRTSFDVAE
jgi:hypothetical protein